MNKSSDIGGAGVNHCSGEKIINNFITPAIFMNQKELGAKFKKAREEKGFTQQKIADELKLSLRAVQYFEKGEKAWSLDKVVTAFKLVGYTFFLAKDIEKVEFD